MNNVYLIYGDEDYFINLELKNIINKYNDYDIINYDMLEFNISNAIDDISMMSLFSSNKVIVCTNCYFLTTNKCEIDHDVDKLLKYLKNVNDSILILIVNSQVDNRKKVVKELLKYNVIKCEKLKDYELSSFVKNYCKNNGYSISNEAINLFLNKLNDNLYILTSELNKLFIYKDNNVIDIDDIKICTSKMINTNIFDLINSIVTRDIDKSLELYDDLLLVNEEEIKLIVTLANQFRLIYQVKSMYKMGFSETDIIRKLDVHPYRIKLANNVNINLDDCLMYLKKLSLLDENIKTGKVDKKVGFEKFILSL